MKDGTVPKTLYWHQGGGCGGDSMALLCLQSPDFLELLRILNIDVLWHPSLSNHTPIQHQRLLESILGGERALDFLCVEGSILHGPGGTGAFDTFRGSPKKDLVAQLAQVARVVVAVGTCSSFGGLGADQEAEASGLQFTRTRPGGLLGESFLSRGGLPVINLPGCPCHPKVVAGALASLCMGTELPLTRFQAPLAWYAPLVHQGCVRNEYHEYRVEEHDFGGKGCLFFHMGCRAPVTHGICNKYLWNEQSTKTRVGVPCFGCTSPNFPEDHGFFESPNIAGVPMELPEGIDRAHYMAYKSMAAAAAPDRLKRRETHL